MSNKISEEENEWANARIENFERSKELLSIADKVLVNDSLSEETEEIMFKRIVFFKLLKHQKSANILSGDIGNEKYNKELSNLIARNGRASFKRELQDLKRTLATVDWATSIEEQIDILNQCKNILLDLREDEYSEAESLGKINLDFLSKIDFLKSKIDQFNDSKEFCTYLNYLEIQVKKQ